MATPEEIRQRVETADTARSARRATAAQQVGELAERRATIVAQLAEVERELGELLADAQDVIDVDELATFTDLKPTDLTEWCDSRKTFRSKRKKAAVNTNSTARRSAQPRATTQGPTLDSRDGTAAASTGASERPVSPAS